MGEPTSHSGGVGQSQQKCPLACQASVKERNSAKRVLFGRPSREETDKWLKGLEDKCVEEKSRRWGFDFKKNRPLEPTSSSGSAPPIEYERVNEKDVPHVYRPVDFPNRTMRSTRTERDNLTIGFTNPSSYGSRSPRKHISAQRTCPRSPRKSARQSGRRAIPPSPTKKKKKGEK